MKRKAQKDLRMPSLAWLPVAAAWLLAAAFVGVSLLMAVVCAWTMGRPAGMEWAFAAIAVAVVGFKALGLPLALASGSRVAVACTIVLVTICYAFTVTAGHQFAKSNLYTASNAAEAANTAYTAAKERVADIRGQLAAIDEKRSADAIRASIEGHKQHRRWLSTSGCTDATVPESFDYCQDYARLQADLAVAEKRDSLKAELPGALAALTAKRSTAGAGHDAGPVAAIVGRLTGYDFASFEEFFAWLIVLAVELGDIIAPLVASMASRPVRREARADPKEQVARIIEEAKAEEEARKALKTEAERAREAKVAQLHRFLNACTERANEGEVKSAALYSVYTTWAIGEALEPMTLQMFGSLMTAELKIPKVKKSSTLYLGLRVKTDWHAAKPMLRVVNE